jgi:hypothetical protein
VTDHGFDGAVPSELTSHRWRQATAPACDEDAAVCDTMATLAAIDAGADDRSGRRQCPSAARPGRGRARGCGRHRGCQEVRARRGRALRGWSWQPRPSRRTRSACARCPSFDTRPPVARNHKMSLYV